MRLPSGHGRVSASRLPRSDHYEKSRANRGVIAGGVAGSGGGGSASLVQSAAAACAAARVAGVTRDHISYAIQEFSGLPHRQELIRTLGQVGYINDRKASNVDYAAKALACYENFHCIAGGQFKEGSIDGLKTHIERIQHAYLIGEAAIRLTEELEGNVEVTRSQDLKTAVGQAHEKAQNDCRPAVVLFSPACASFDQFANFEERGDGFRAAVELLV